MEVKNKIDLGGGFFGYEIISPKGITVIAEEKSGAIVGNSLEQVKKDISLGVVGEMDNQVSKTMEESKSVKIIQSNIFWNRYEKNFSK